MNGGVWIFLFVAEALVVGAVLWNGFEPIRYATLVLAMTGLAYEMAFFVIGVSAAMRYLHVVVFIGGISIPLFFVSVLYGPERGSLPRLARSILAKLLVWLRLRRIRWGRAST
jgi:NADH:ubiquinone oxidoreductase subunit 6 (subunit J)